MGLPEDAGKPPKWLISAHPAKESYNRMSDPGNVSQAAARAWVLERSPIYSDSQF